MENDSKDQEEQFECPSCGINVKADAKVCPGCNAIFEEQGDDPTSPTNNEAMNSPPPPDSKWNQYPPPPWQNQNPNNPSMGITQETLPPPPEPAEELSTIDSVNTENKTNPPPLGVREFSSSPFVREVEGEKSPSLEENEMITNSEEEIEDDAKAREDSTEEDSSISPETEDEEPYIQDDEDKKAIDLPESLRVLQGMENEIQTYNEKNRQDIINEKRIVSALEEYSESRRKRHFMGTMFLGLGVVLFVLLWLVVVYDVLITESTQWFGAHVALILVGAGIFFTFGLYLILTYPKSSLIEVLASVSRSNQNKKSVGN
jgi:hypothetical protein